MNESVTLVLPVADVWRSVTVPGLTATVTASVATVESFSAMRVMSVDLSEQDRVMQKARAVVSMPSSLRFMIIPMNRATGFSPAPNYFCACAPQGAGICRNGVVAVNA